MAHCGPEASLEHVSEKREDVAKSVTDPVEAEPPVVARLVVELRSDGRCTIARGAVEDVRAQERVSLEVGASSPWDLVRLLARELTRSGRSSLELPGRAVSRSSKVARRLRDAIRRG